jgi:hypothetical protein
LAHGKAFAVHMGFFTVHLVARNELFSVVVYGSSDLTE